MHVVTRTYPSVEVAAILVAHKDEVERLLRTAPGFVSWVLIKTGNTCMTATICQDKAGCDRSVEIAREWVSKNVPSTVGAPQIQDGEVLLRLT